MFSKEAIALAPKVYEAIKKIAERTMIECPTCAGRGRESVLGDYAMRQTSQECKRCNGTGKVKGKWEWEPEVGEWCCDRSSAELLRFRRIVNNVNDNEILVTGWGDKVYTVGKKTTRLQFLGWSHKKGFIPLLHWEKIEEVLEGMGYRVSEICWHLDDLYYCRITPKVESPGFNAFATGKTRQLAVMRAVIEPGKEH